MFVNICFDTLSIHWKDIAITNSLSCLFYYSKQSEGKSLFYNCELYPFQIREVRSEWWFMALRDLRVRNRVPILRVSESLEASRVAGPHVATVPQARALRTSSSGDWLFYINSIYHWQASLWMCLRLLWLCNYKSLSGDKEPQANLTCMMMLPAVQQMRLWSKVEKTNKSTVTIIKAI